MKFPAVWLKRSWPVGLAVPGAPPLLLAFSSDGAADDTDPLWHLTLCSLIAAVDAKLAHRAAASLQLS